MGNIIYLQHEHAERFFERAMQPDMYELRQRDDFLAMIEQELNVQSEGTDLVTEIPNIDLMGMISNANKDA